MKFREAIRDYAEHPYCKANSIGFAETTLCKYEYHLSEIIR